MPTKPNVQPEAWATDAVYTTGPFIGQPQKVVPPGAFAAEGHRPGNLFPTPAEYENSQQNRITGLARWLFLGTYDPDPDAHVVETDATGRAGLHGLNVYDTADETAIDITGVNTLAPTVLATCTTGATVIQSDVGNSTGTCFGASVGTGAGVGLAIAMTGSALGALGIRIDADVASNASGLEINMAGGGYGANITGGPAVEALNVVGGDGQVAGNFDATTGVATVAALAATGSTGTTSAMLAIGTGTCAGGIFSGGTTDAFGLRATGGGTAYGVHGRTATNGTAVSAGVFGEGRDTGAMGVYARSDAGIGIVVRADLTSPAYPEMLFTGQNADPTDTTGGNFYRSSTQKQLRHCVAGYGYRGLAAYGPGSAVHAVETMAVGATAANATGTLTALLTATCDDAEGNGLYGSALGAEVRIRFSCDVRSTGGAVDYMQLEIQDTTNTATIATWSGAGSAAQDAFYLPVATANWQRSIIVEIPYAFPADGTTQFQALIARQTAGITVRNARLVIDGTFQA